MDKQDELAAVIIAAWDENGEVPFPLYEREAQRIAAAVRSYMGSEGLVVVPRDTTKAMREAGADQLFAAFNEDWGDDADAIWKAMIGAALSAALGTDIGGGRG